jgi:hypothetical protein
MSGLITICFVGTKELGAALREWAREDERSVSYVLRQILEKEARRHAAKSQKDQMNDNH